MFVYRIWLEVIKCTIINIFKIFKFEYIKKNTNLIYIKVIFNLITKSFLKTNLLLLLKLVASCGKYFKC